MDPPPSAPDDDIELRPLVSSARQNSSRDAPADDVVLPWSSSARPPSSSRPPLHGASGSGATNIGVSAAHTKRRNRIQFNDNNNHQSAVVEQYDDSTKTTRKKMTLLLMMTFVVILLVAILEKRSAAVVRTPTVGMELGSSETKSPAVHESTKDIKQQQSSDEEKTDTTNDSITTNSHNTNNNIKLDGYQPTTMIYPSNYILPGTEDAPPLSAAKGRPYYPVLNHFQFRNPTSPYASTWGYFNFRDPNPKWDGKMRPQPTNYDTVPNRDVKNSDFPKEAWQSDDAYMKEFLVQAKLLVNRTIEAVYAEYGVGIPADGSVTLTDEQMINRELFAPFLLAKDASINPPGEVSWSTQPSFDGIARRIIHHIMTGDTFKLTLGGHSAAAGHGAGFNQSYVIEAGHVLEPVFAHLGVEFRAYNFAQGGMGTFQQALAGMDLRGKETDWMIWDSSMTEKSPEIVNFFFRQALISGNRSPVLMGDGVINSFHEIAGAAIATAAGNGWVPVTDNDEQVMDLPWAAQWLQCSRTATTDCKAHEYTAGCWVEREDFKPPTAQDALVGGAAAWHPGNRIHKRKGRMIALVVLRSLAYALDKWEELGAKSGYPIAEEHWHVSDYYKTIREKATQVPGCFGDNWKIGQKRHLEEMEEDEANAESGAIDGRKLDDTDFWPPRICDIPLQGRSLWGPRSNPVESSLVSIMKPNAFGDIDPTPKNTYWTEPIYYPPDRPAPWTAPPETEPFAPLIGASRRMTVEEQTHHQLRGGDLTNIFHGVLGSRALSEESGVNDTSNEVVAKIDAITPGLGIQVNWGYPGVCDGSSHHWCDKRPDSTCLMAGSQDHRGMVCFDGFSGWVVFDVKNVKHGFIGARMEPWHGAEETPITATWTEENNGGNGNYQKRGLERQLHEEYQQEQMRESIERMKREIEKDILSENDPSRRRLGGGQHCGYPADYTFEWAINGEVTSWSKAEFCDHFTRLNYNLDVIKFMDDESQTGDFELAMRVTNVERGMAMCISHLYWA